jgi:16S rRNA U516 pseudouridylate synthase RsuA-like enzyme
MERLNRFLARSGIASRRASDRLILTGKVRVNGLPVARTGIRIDPLRDRVDFDGKRVEPPKAFTTTVLNKPPGFLVSSTIRITRKRFSRFCQVSRGCFP